MGLVRGVYAGAVEGVETREGGAGFDGVD